MIETAYLLEKDGLPPIPPRREERPREVVIVGGGDVSAAQDGEGETAMVSREEPVQRPAAAVLSAAVDPFAYMDFRVGWANNVATINRGRVHYVRWSPPGDKFTSSTAIIEADEVPLVLAAGDEDASVWLSLPFSENGSPLLFGADVTGASFAVREYSDPDGHIRYYSNYWSSFDFAQHFIRAGYASTTPKFAVATTALAPTPIAATDYLLELARVGFTTGVRPIHFGSVWPTPGFDANYSP